MSALKREARSDGWAILRIAHRALPSEAVGSHSIAPLLSLHVDSEATDPPLQSESG
jgi:hypothetical protein